MSEEKLTNQTNTDKECPKGACPTKKTSIGGQALMEGIMMRGPKMTAMAVRNPQGEIVLEKFPTVSGKRPWPWRVPVIRGIFNFADTMVFGYKCLMRSAEISGLEEAEEELEREKQEKKKAKAEAKARKKAEKEGKPFPEEQPVEAPDPDETPVPAADSAPADAPAADEAQPAPVQDDAAENAPAQDVPAEDAPAENVSAEAAPAEKKKDGGTSGLMILITVISVVLAVALMIGLFILLPTFLFDTAAEHISWLDADNRWAKSVFTGIIKIILLVGYMSAISLMKDIRRTYMFHGAEHKTIFCYEAGLELTVENVRKMKRFHPRCGTSFLILMVLVSILVGFFIPPVLVANKALNTLVYSGIRLALVPLICGLGYELIKFCGRHDNWLTRIIAAPGVALQHLTVFEPDDDMIECAITAVKEVIPEDGSDNW